MKFCFPVTWKWFKHLWVSFCHQNQTRNEGVPRIRPVIYSSPWAVRRELEWDFPRRFAPLWHFPPCAPQSKRCQTSADHVGSPQDLPLKKHSAWKAEPKITSFFLPKFSLNYFWQNLVWRPWTPWSVWLFGFVEGLRATLDTKFSLLRKATKLTASTAICGEIEQLCPQVDWVGQKGHTARMSFLSSSTFCFTSWCLTVAPRESTSHPASLPVVTWLRSAQLVQRIRGFHGFLP